MKKILAELDLGELTTDNHCGDCRHLTDDADCIMGFPEPEPCLHSTGPNNEWCVFFRTKKCRNAEALMIAISTLLEGIFLRP